MGILEAFGRTSLPTGLDAVALTLLKAGYTIPGAALGGAAYYTVGTAIGQDGQGIANTNWNLLSTALSVGIGTLYWGETLSDRQWMGVALAGVSFWLLNSTPSSS